MPGRAAKVIITERQQEALQRMTRSGSCAQAIDQRAHLILLAFAGQTNEQIAEGLGCERHAVGSWRRRWAAAWDRLVIVECCEGNGALRRAIAEVLGDAPRSGSPGKFTAEQIAQNLAVACEPPENRGVLKSVASRKAFLTDLSHRIRFVDVPKHTSWLNQIESWFSILVRRVIKRGNFTSESDRRGKLLAFIDSFNRTLAKPFKWTFTGRPLKV